MRPGDLLGGPDLAPDSAALGTDLAASAAAVVPVADGAERRPPPPVKSSRALAAALQRGAGSLYEASPAPPRNERLYEEAPSAVPAGAPLLVMESAANLSGDATADQKPDPRIVGSGDRAHHLALVNGVGTPLLRRPSGDPLMRLPGARPTSRATCERRCGRAGFCDPSSPYGCGGEFCQGFQLY